MAPRRFSLVTNPVINHERGKDREVLTTSGTHPWSFVTQIFHNVLIGQDEVSILKVWQSPPWPGKLLQNICVTTDHGYISIISSFGNDHVIYNKSSTTAATNGAETAYSFRVHYCLSEAGIAQSSVFYVVYGRSLFVLFRLLIASFVSCWFNTSDYPIGILSFLGSLILQVHD
jgi:hypothetical protein